MLEMKWQRRIGEYVADTYFDSSGGDTTIVRWRLYRPLTGYWAIGLTIGESGGHLPVAGHYESFAEAKERAKSAAIALGHRLKP